MDDTDILCMCLIKSPIPLKYAHINRVGSRYEITVCCLRTDVCAVGLDSTIQTAFGDALDSLEAKLKLCAPPEEPKPPSMWARFRKWVGV